MNSLGVRLARRNSYIGGYISAVIKRGDDVGSFYDFDAARVMEDFEPDGIGRSAVEQAMKFLGARKVEYRQNGASFSGPLASMSVFSGVAGQHRRGRYPARQVVYDRQTGREDQHRMLLSITDDPLIARGLGSRGYDSEGAPCAPLALMENGVLKSYLYGSYTAAKAGSRRTPVTARAAAGASTSNVIPKLGEDHQRRDHQRAPRKASISIWAASTRTA